MYISCYYYNPIIYIISVISSMEFIDLVVSQNLPKNRYIDIPGLKLFKFLINLLLTYEDRMLISILEESKVRYIYIQ